MCSWAGAGCLCPSLASGLPTSASNAHVGAVSGLSQDTEPPQGREVDWRQDFCCVCLKHLTDQVIAYRFVGSGGASPRAQREGTASDFSRSRNFGFLCEIAPIGEIFGSNSGPLWLGSLRPVRLRDPSSDSCSAQLPSLAASEPPARMNPRFILAALVILVFFRCPRVHL